MDRLDDISLTVYRVSMKLLSLQKLCQMDVVFLRHITAAFIQGGGANLSLDRKEVTETLDRMFYTVSQEVPGHLMPVEQMCTLVFQLFDWTGSGSVSAGSVQTLLLVLSADTLPVKYTALVDLAGTGSGSISRSGLRSLLDHLNQVPAAVHEPGVFGGVEAAVLTCFNGVWAPTVTKDHVFSWLQSEPPLLLWLPTLYRLFISQSIRHRVCCHACRTTPITGLRFRCLRCVNVHVCQSCFLADKHTRRHKLHHPVLEFCTQPTWRETLLWLVRRGGQAPPPLQAAQRWADRTSRGISHHASFSSKCLQTENSQHEQVTEQLQDCTRALQSQHSSLQDCYSGLQVTMETLRKQNMFLQDMLAQALDKVEARQHIMSLCVTMETEEKIMPTCGTETCTDGEEEKRALKKKDEVKSGEDLNSFATMQKEAASASDTGRGDGVGTADEATFCQQTHDSGAAWTLGGLSADQWEATERLMQESVDRLKTLMETDARRERQTGDKRWAKLLAAAEQVEDSIHHLVDAVRTKCDVSVSPVTGQICPSSSAPSKSTDYWLCSAGPPDTPPPHQVLPEV